MTFFKIFAYEFKMRTKTPCLLQEAGNLYPEAKLEGIHLEEVLFEGAHKLFTSNRFWDATKKELGNEQVYT